MKGTRISGLAFHVHHYQLYEYCYDYDERVTHIRKCKPKSEQKLRLQLFKIIPHDRLPQKGLATYDKALAAIEKSWATYYRAGDAYANANRKALEALHKELCPNCPWDGKTIFPNK